MELRVNQSPVYTAKHLDHLAKHRLAYGENVFTSDVIEQERTYMEKGFPSPRCGPSGTVYEIFLADEHIGDVVLVRNNFAEFGMAAEERYELDLTIFDEFAGQGHGKRALEAFLQMYREHYTQTLEVIVSHGNPLKARVEHLLQGAGFAVTETLGNGDEVYTLQS